MRPRNELEEIVAMVEEKRRKLMNLSSSAELFLGFMFTVQCECLRKLLFLLHVLKELMQMQREAQQANELSNLTRQRQLLASVNYRRAIIEELERLLINLVAYKTREHLKHIQKAVLVEVIKLKRNCAFRSLHKEVDFCRTL
ncbi:hypothetical protein Tco_1450297 [Tanacetum coccineum]